MQAGIGFDKRLVFVGFFYFTTMTRMNQKGNVAATPVMVGIVTLVLMIIVGITVSDSVREVAIGNYVKATTTGNYATDFNADRVVNFTVSNVVTDTAGSVQIAHDNHSDLTNITVNGVSLGSLANNHPERQTFTVPTSVLGGSVVAFTFDLQAPAVENITDINFTYTQYSGCDTYYELCESGDSTYDLANAGFTLIPVMALILAATAVVGAIMLLSRR